jgi:hypothetical protein
MSVPLGSFRIFSKIRGDNREGMFIIGINDYYFIVSFFKT